MFTELRRLRLFWSSWHDQDETTEGAQGKGQAAEIYDDVKRERIVKSNEEREAKDSLINLMVEHGLKLYETPDGLQAIVTDKHNVKTKKRTIGGVDGEFVPEDEE